MAQYAYCGEKTSLFEAGVPLCMLCDELPRLEREKRLAARLRSQESASQGADAGQQECTP